MKLTRNLSILTNNFLPDLFKYQCTGENELLKFLRTGYSRWKRRKSLSGGVGLGNSLLPKGYMWGLRREGDRPRKIEKVIKEHMEKKKPKDLERIHGNYITQKDIRQ